MKTRENEVLRYLGCHNSQQDERLLSIIRQVADELEACVNPKSSFGIYGCLADSPIVTIGDMRVSSKSLSVNLKDCRKAALMALTLGTGADSLIRRYSVRDMEKAAVAQAVCAAMTEEYCDQLECEILSSPESEGLRSVARFSPGYGDFDVTHQKDILRLLDCSRRMGLTLTDGYMLAPTKSVTAVVGLTGLAGLTEKSETHKTHKKHISGKCANCGNKQCAYREAAIQK